MRRLAALFRLNEEGWARHANPWSVYTRNTCLPLITLALWSREAIGAWFLLPLALSLAWTWWNPRAFSPPRRLDAWASRAVLGERRWLARGSVPIPAHHARAALVLSGVSLAGVPFWMLGVIRLEPWPTLVGLALIMLGKLWFCDRMVWLEQDMSATPGLTPPPR